MRGRHRIPKSLAAAVAVAAVCAAALALGYVMGNYAITAVTKPRKVAPPAASPPASAPRSQAAPKTVEPPPPAGDSLLTVDGGAGPDVPSAAPPTPAAQPPREPLYRVHVGPFATRQEAVAASGKLLAEGYPTYVAADRPYRVQVGAFSRRESAERLVAELRSRNYTNVHLVEP